MKINTTKAMGITIAQKNSPKIVSDNLFLFSNISDKFKDGSGQTGAKCQS